LALTGCTTVTTAALSEIPEQFRGNWVVEKSTCGIEGSGNDGDIGITANAVSFHAEPYRVKTLRQDGAVVYATYFPPDQQYMQPPTKLFLSADGNELSGIWYRCRGADE
jgi:hypothetical protein